jgi:molybdopterin converting factor small subunit
MKVRVLLFGPEAAAAGRDCVTVNAAADSGAGAITCGQLSGLLADACPALRPSLATARFAVNGEFAPSPETPVREGDEVALIGLVSGG